MTLQDFYKSKKIDLDKMKSVAMNRSGIAPEVIDRAAELVYEKFESVGNPKNIVIAQRILAEAKAMQGSTRAVSLIAQSEKIKKLTKRVEILEQPSKYWWLFVDIKTLNLWERFKKSFW